MLNGNRSWCSESALKETVIIDPITSQKIVKKGDLEFPRKVWMKPGCQMNHHDSERIVHHLCPKLTATQDLNEGDLVLFNTCAVRDLSNNKFYSQLGEIKHAKKKKNCCWGGGGCVLKLKEKS